MQKITPYLLAGLVSVVFVFAFALTGATQVAAATNCAAVPGYTLSTAALCTTTTVTLSGTTATITSSTVRQDASGTEQGLPPSNWGIASDIRVFIDDRYYCGSSTHTVSCFVANLSGGPHQFKTIWTGSASSQSISTTNYDSFTIALPNLTVSSITPIGTPTVNQSFAIQAVITNNGTASAASSWAQTAIGVQGSSNATISGFTTPALAAGSSYTATFSYTPAIAGTYAINVCADVGGSVAESNEDPYTDNCKTVPVTVSAPAVTSVTADLKSNGADGPLTIGYRQSVPLSWISTNATGCSILIPGLNSVSGGPSGFMTAGPLESSGVVVLTCTNASGANGSDTLTVNVSPAPTPSISNVFAAPSTFTRGDYLTITIVGEEFGATPGVLEEMTGYGGTVKNSYVRGEYNRWELTWSNTQISVRIFPSVTQDYALGPRTVYVRVANQFNQRSTVQPVTATVNPGSTSALAPTLTEVYVNPRPGIRGQTATAFFNGVLNADSCTFQYKGTGEAAWGNATTGSCTTGVTFTVPADLPRGLYLLQGRACRNDGTCSEYRQMVGEWQINPSPTEPAVTSGRAVIDGFRVITPDTLLIPASTSAAPTTNVHLTATLRQALTVSLYYPCRAGFNILTAANVQLACNDETTNTFPLSNDSGGFRTAEPIVLVSNAVAGGGTIELRLNAIGLDGVRVSRSVTFTLAGGTAATPIPSPIPSPTSPTPSIFNTFAAPSTVAQGDYLTITLTGDNFGANPGVLEEMTGYGGTVKNSYVRGEYNRWDLTWTNTQIAFRLYPSVTQTYTTGSHTLYLRVTNSFNRQSNVVSVSATVTGGTATNSQSQTQSQTQSQSQTPPLQSSVRPLVRAQSDTRVFAIVNNQRFWIPDTQTFEAAGYRWSDVRVVSDVQVGQYARLRLVRAGSDSAVYYITESGLKRLIPSPAVFASYGNRWEDVVSISQVELAAYQSVAFIHRGDGRVYKIENGVKRWVKTEEAFRRLGGRWDQIAPVNQTEFESYPLGADIE
ncbi:hypothetical protein HYZ80_02720 [Candidatus Parcubacteria bacterium]|nr:hypothetical protein [Candidatus Parcubacteria bacterium]